MSAPIDQLLAGYLTAPVVHAAAARGWFAALSDTRWRAQEELEQPSAESLPLRSAMLHVLTRVGTLAMRADGRLRMSAPRPAPGVLSGLAALYVGADDERAAAVAARPVVEQLLAGRGRVSPRPPTSAAPDWLAGALVVPMLAWPSVMRAVDTGGTALAEALDALDPVFADKVVTLFRRHGWIAARGRGLHSAGQAVLAAPELRAAGRHAAALWRSLVEPDTGHQPPDANFWRLLDECAVIDGSAPMTCSLRREANAESGGDPANARERHARAAPVDGDPALAPLGRGLPSWVATTERTPLSGAQLLLAWQRTLAGLAASDPGAQWTLSSRQLTPATARVCGSAWAQDVLHDLPQLLGGALSLDAETLLLLAAREGWFNEAPPQRWPESGTRCRAVRHALRRRPYRVRHAESSDLPRLVELEKLCWRHTRTPRQRLRERLQREPLGQLVLEVDGRVAGVIYSQRIDDVAALHGCTAAAVHRLHRSDGRIVQLLAVNVDPAVQNLGYGDQLLEFMLQRCSLMADVERVVGVTLCTRYSAQQDDDFDTYIQRQGAGVDPVLAFHRAHGATVVGRIAGYRPDDADNAGNGVLVSYHAQRRRPAGATAQAAHASGPRLSAAAIRDAVDGAVSHGLAQRGLAYDAHRPLMEMGLDSADLLSLQQVLQTRLGITLASGTFFSHPTAARLIEHLTTAHAATPVELPGPGAAADSTAETQRHTDAPESRARDVAIIGMACRLPGGIDSPEALWQALASQRDAIGPYPRERGPWPSSAEAPSLAHGGFVDGADCFDAAFFRMSPVEAQITDPQQRMLMELSWHCLEDAGVLPASLRGTDTGVYVGASQCDYARLMQDLGTDVAAHHGIGSSLAVLANRLSYFYDLHGPSLTVDTACSSSLVALHTALRALRGGDCALAFVAGVNFICQADLSLAYQRAGMLSPDGRCKTFDAAADGYVRAEGAVGVLLKPVPAALRDGDRIHAVIRGSAVNHGGLAGGLTVPNPRKQADLLRAAWRDAGVRAADLAYHEAHGTGTALGDPIEIEGLVAARTADAQGQPLGPCAVGSIKSNLGHLEAAAGLAGLLKVVLALKHRHLPATLHVHTLNPRIELAAGVGIQQRGAEWSASGPRRAGISSFGSGGANAHVVVESWDAPLPPPVQSARLFVLSAASDERLRASVMRVIAWLRAADPDAARLDAALATWQLSRTEMAHRIAVRAEDAATLQRRLQAWLDRAVPEEGLWSGGPEDRRPDLHRIWAGPAARQLVEQLVAARDVDPLGILWVNGVAIDFQQLYPRQRPLPVSLPTYPFAPQRHWINVTQPAPQRHAAVGRLHPLLHENRSDAHSLAYRSRFSGREPFLSEHRVVIGPSTPQPILPAVAYLEMAIAAMRAAHPDQPPDAVVALRDVVWLRPLVVSDPQTVHIRLEAEEGRETRFEVCSEEGDASETVYAQGAVGFVAGSGAQADAPADRRGTVERSLEAAEHQALMRSIGLHYGPSFQGLRRLTLHGREAQAELALDAVHYDASSGYTLHPGIADAAIQAAVGLLCAQTPTAQLPFALDELTVFAALPAHAHVLVGSFADGPPLAGAKLEVEIRDPQGRLCARFRGLTTRALPATSEAPSTQLATAVWRPAPRLDAATGTPRDVAGLVLLCGAHASRLAAVRAALPELQCSAIAEDPLVAVDDDPTAMLVALFDVLRAQVKALGGERRRVQVVIDTLAGAPLSLAVAGMLKSLSIEHPQWRAQVIAMPVGVPGSQLAQALRTDAQRSAFAIRHGDSDDAAQVCEQLSYEFLPAPPPAPPGLRERGVYLITGGLGALGRTFARDILSATRDARVVLCGRSALDAARAGFLRTLDPGGERLHYTTLDLQDASAVQRTVSEVLARHGRLDGILHCAGALGDGLAVHKSAGAFASVLAPKVRGTLHLDRATAELDLDFFALFASVVGTFGNVGQSDYACANGFLDGFAALRNTRTAEGLRRGRTVAIDWPLWRDGGMQQEASASQYWRDIAGLQPLPSAQGLQAFHQALAAPHDQVLVLHGEVEPLQRLLRRQRLAAEPEPAPAPAARVAPDAGTADALQAAATAIVRAAFAEKLKLAPGAIDASAPLGQYGIDSILAVALVNRLEKDFGPLPKTLLFEYQTLEALAGHFAATQPQRLSVPPGGTAAAARSEVASTALPVSEPPPITRPLRRRTLDRDDAPPQRRAVAIVGLSGRYPQSVDVEAYWRNLLDGRDCIVEVPRQRWDWQAYYSTDRGEPGRHFSKWGGFIEGIDEFDPQFFNIAPREAPYIDPQERMFLQHAWMAVEDAGYTRAGLQAHGSDDFDAQVGVYVGVMWGEYQLHGLRTDPRQMRMGFAGNPASIANRVSFALNLHGPSMTLDTMCSSSLTALHVACQDLRAGRTSMAIAGGVNLSVHPQKYLMLSAGQFISSDGHCQSFGEGGDGYIPGEGVGAVLLKRLDDAERDGDRIYGVIRGSALSHGGRTNGYTVPNPLAQAAAIRHALRDAQVEPRSISYLEAHGTGTRLGDPIEIAALTRAFDRPADEAPHCRIGSAKSNIGHCEAAAGIAGLTKVLLQMQHRKIVPSLHAERLNPHIDFERTPFVVNRTLTDWDVPVVDGRPQRRIAGISSFGAGGSNAHMIVEEYPVDTAASVTVAPPYAFPLSARTAQQLHDKAADLLAFLTASAPVPDLAAVAYTLQVGREAMAHRAGFLAATLAELVEGLRAFVAGERAPARVDPGDAAVDPEVTTELAAAIARGQHRALLQAWVAGHTVDWSRAYPGARPPRVRLPAYPFARQRYWIPDTGGAGVSAVLHPLLHSNVSDLEGLRFRSRLDRLPEWVGAGAEHARPTPSPGLCLEMAREACGQMLSLTPEVAATLQLTQLQWCHPLPRLSDGTLDIALWAEADAAVGFEILCGPPTEATVVCQGRAQRVDAPTASAPLTAVAAPAAMPERHLLSMPYPAVGEALAAHSYDAGTPDPGAVVQLPAGLREEAARYALHPVLIDAVLTLTGQSPPLTLSTLTLHAPCPSSVRVRMWRRTARQCDIGIETLDGRPIATLEGVQSIAADVPVSHAVVAPESAATPAVAPTASAPSASSVPPAAARSVPMREIALRAPSPTRARRASAFAAVQLDKPAGRVLPAPAALPPFPPVTVAGWRRAPLILPTAGSLGAAPNASPDGTTLDGLRLFDAGSGVFILALPEADVALDEPTASALERALDEVQRQQGLRVLVLRGPSGRLISGGRAAQGSAAQRRLLTRLLDFPMPVIAAIDGTVSGMGLLAVAMCDLIVASADSSMDCGVAAGCCITRAESELLSERFGTPLAQRLLQQAGPLGAMALRELGWAARVVPASDVAPQADRLARALSGKSVDALTLLRRHLLRGLRARVDALADADADAEAGPDPALPQVPEDALAPGAPAQGIDKAEHAEVLMLRVLKTSAAPAEVYAELTGELRQAQRRADVRAVVLVSEREDFLPDAPDAPSVEALLSLLGQIERSGLPVVAACAAAGGIGWLVALSCTTCLHGRSGRFSAASLLAHPALQRRAVGRFERCFGAVVGLEWLLSAEGQPGAALLERIPALRVVDDADLQQEALSLARAWTLQARRLTVSWPPRPAPLGIAAPADLAVLLDEEDVDADMSSAAGQPLRLASDALRATLGADGVLDVRIEDRAARNLFSEAVVSGLHELFAMVERMPACKVVVLSGYDTYFLSGGSKDNLIAIQEGRSRFTDLGVFHLPLNCRLPVIAAMQGHGIGAGWSLGMFADVTLFAEESRYVSPYMNYGFTPGAGATLTLPARLGADLGRELLLGGELLSGRELRDRAPIRVHRRDDVLPSALALAARLARHSRRALIAVKAQFAQPLRAQLADVYARELEMHAQTFVGRDDTRALIERRFAGDATASPPATEEAAAEVPAARARPAARSETVADTLRDLLAQELHLTPDDIDEHARFVDLGMDSISGVTWVRKLNEAFSLRIEATHIYAHPTLAQMSAHVRGQLGEVPAPGSGTTPAMVASSVAAKPPQATGAARSSDVLAKLRRLLVDELHLDDDVDEHARFVDLGMDSISGVTWVRKLNEAFGLSVEATRIYAHPTLAQMAAYVASRLGTPVAAAAAPEPPPAALPPQQPVETAAAPASFDVGRTARRLMSRRPGKESPKTASVPRPIAVIGIAGQFPKAGDVHAFWRNIANARDCIDEIPLERWDVAPIFQAGSAGPGMTNSRWMGALDDYAAFDPLFFSISPTEAESMDPQQRLFLQACWHGIEDAGYDPSAVSGTSCGVFVGCTHGDYELRSREHRLSAQGFVGGANSILAARISYFLNLRGPSLSIDTACSSSLVALAHACDALNAGDCAMALAGGVYVMAGPEMHIKTAQAGMLSSDGRCFTFDARANGFVPGEAVGVAVLKRLDDALRDGDLIHGVVEGWGVNQDGKTNGITAPNPEAQTALARRVYARFGVDPAGLQLIEAHGTGTQLGDPIEVEGLKQAFAGSTAAPGACALGSVKSNIGHCLTAAGIAGFIKLLMAFAHRQLPPTLHFDTLNPHIALDGSPFYVNDRLRPWDVAEGATRRAAISSFGFSGTNAHLVLREAPVAPSPALPIAAAPPLLVLSARQADQLRAQARRLAERLATVSGTEELRSVAYSLQVGREAMEHRAALVADDVETARSALIALADGRSDGARLHRAETARHREELRLLAHDREMRDLVVARWIEQGRFDALLDLWVKGLDIDWSRLYPAGPPPRVRLPLYPFARERYWVDADAGPSHPAAHAAAQLHPLVHVNVSSLDTQRYRTELRGDEFFLRDHRVRFHAGEAVRTLPGVAYLEMARAAIVDATAVPAASVRLQDVVWLAPVVVEQPQSLSISLYAVQSAVSGEPRRIEFEVSGEREGAQTLHCQGVALLATPATVAVQPLAAVRSQLTGRVEASRLYGALGDMGLDYGPAHRAVRSVAIGESELLADLTLPTEARDRAESYGLHPSLMDAALQASAAFRLQSDGGGAVPSVPFALDVLEFFAPCPQQAVARLRLRPGAQSDPRLVKVDIDLCDTQGNVCVRMLGFATRALAADDRQPPSGFDDAFYRRLIERVVRQELSAEQAAGLG